MVNGRAVEKYGTVLAKVSRDGVSPNFTALRPNGHLGSPSNPAMARPLYTP
jgi:hypothetical protein